jgi:hypothetical protein
VNISLVELVCDYAIALKNEDAKRLNPNPTYLPGVGPYTETKAITAATDHLRKNKSVPYGLSKLFSQYPNNRKIKCDLVIPDMWAIEFKILRPFNDNGKEAEGQWTQNILHPYPKSPAANSAIADYVRLKESNFHERKAIVVYGFEHSPPIMPLEIAIRSFEIIARQILGLDIGERYESRFTDLVHPVFQQGAVFGWARSQAIRHAAPLFGRWPLKKVVPIRAADEGTPMPGLRLWARPQRLA